MPSLTLNSATSLPADGYDGALAGRVWNPRHDGPSVVAIREDGVYGISEAFPTMRDLCENAEPAMALRSVQGGRIGSLEEILANTPADRRDPATAVLSSRRSICRR